MNFKIGVLSYNHPELTSQTLKSILKLELAPENICLCHNGSEARWVLQLQKDFPQIEHLILKENKGFTGGTNHLLSHLFLNNTWVLFLTNDVELLQISPPDLLKTGMHAPKILRRKGQVIDSMGGTLDLRTGTLQHCRSEEDFKVYKKHLTPYIPGTAFWLHKKVFESTGFFNETLHTYWEDVDYSQRVLSKNYPLGLDTETILTHKVGKTCHKKKVYTSYLFPRNKYWITLKYNESNWRKMLFKIYYWKQWSFELLKGLMRADWTAVQWKFKILEQILNSSLSSKTHPEDPTLFK
jgi:GT2 family glycosyltransferase